MYLVMFILGFLVGFFVISVYYIIIINEIIDEFIKGGLYEDREKEE